MVESNLIRCSGIILHPYQAEQKMISIFLLMWTHFANKKPLLPPNKNYVIKFYAINLEFFVAW